MTISRKIVAVAAAALLLSGCASAAPTPAQTSTPAPSVSAAPEVAVATSAIVSLDGFTVLDQNGVELSSATFDDSDAVLALLTDLLGNAPEKEDSPKVGMTYSWPGVSFNDYVGVLVIDAAEIGGLPVATTQGIAVGSSRADVQSLSPVAVYGTTDDFGLEATEVAGTESLAVPGQVGTGFVSVRLTGDVVTSIATPSGDFYDL